MPTCPNGHQSGAEDWCEVCGHRMSVAATPMGAAPPPPVPPAPPGTGGYGYPAAGDPTMQAELCPECRTPREASAPFCEECRYNFLTHSPTSYTPPQSHGFESAPPPSSQHTQHPPGFEYHGSRPSQINRPAEQLVPQGPAHTFGEEDWVLTPPGSAQTASPYPYEPGPHPAESGPQAVPPQTPGPAVGVGWVAVVAPDREYFVSMMNRSGPEAAGLNLPAYTPELQFPLAGHQVTIGRRRHSTGESPDIDLARPPEDPGVSHQHAMLVQQPDGSWAVVDRDSTNGTTINGSEESIQPFVPVPLHDGDRVHVGAWTTITVRRG
ncbi:hypothetical protein VR41_08320 [Streptomyces sp. NRRL B-1568]|nr:hypothetical protein VR41_08320 [Streptomyces sp. NRRL B-1568]